MKFVLSLEPVAAVPMESPSSGGFVTFEGKVRDHADGREVDGLEYEAFDDMAVAQGEALLREAIEKFGLEDATALHRLGQLGVGDTAIVVQTAAAHRREAFEAAEWIMDQVKWRVPIWKKESYKDGPSEWVHAESQPLLSPLAGRFARQLALPEIGEDGQQKLIHARVLIVGAGGLSAGSVPAIIGAGVGTLGIIDGDLVDETNLHRQMLFAASDVGRSKAERVGAWAKRQHPGCKVDIFPERLTESNVERLVANYDWIVDGTDSLPTKFLLNRVSRQLEKPLVLASIHRFDGQILTVMPDGPCLQCLYPVEPPSDCVGTCAQEGVLGVLPLIFGGLQANEVIKGILGLPVLKTEMLIGDLRECDFEKIRRNVSPNCPCCSGALTEELGIELATYEAFFEKFGGEGQVIDIRDVEEGATFSLAHRRVSLNECLELSFDHPTLFVCASGARSYRLVATLRARGNDQVHSLQGGGA